MNLSSVTRGTGRNFGLCMVGRGFVLAEVRMSAGCARDGGRGGSRLRIADCGLRIAHAQL